MKKIISIIAIVMGLSYAHSSMAQEVIQDTMSMSEFYETDIFYSLKNGTVATAVRANWDIAFYTQRFSAGVMINDGSGHMLYTYPKGDTSAWSSIDSTGMSSWAVMHNSEIVWEEGAFNRHSTGHPDYGWGIYNMVDHHVYGDSLYIIMIPEVGYKKIWIKEKKSVDNIYIFKYADLDGSNEMEVELDVKPYENKRFVYYSLSANEVLDREPEAESWDILFTKFIDMVPDLEGNMSPYNVTGVTSNVDIGVNQAYPVGPDFNDWSFVPMDSLKNKIGWDWKSFDFGSFSWTLQDSNYYFVQTYSGDVYKLWFTMWEGSGTGNLALAKQMSSPAFLFDQNEREISLQVYPNPATSAFSVRSDENLSGPVVVNIIDFAGRLVFQREYNASELNSGIGFSDLGLQEGMYIINLNGDGYQTSRKLMIR